MNYSLNKNDSGEVKPPSTLYALRKLLPLVSDEKGVLIGAFVAVLVNSLLSLIAPRLIAHAVDTFIPTRNFNGLLVYAALILGMYIVAFLTSYLQTSLMGKVGQKVLFNLRSALFAKIQSLPVAFFNQNKSGDLISRLNNDTENINQFFSRSLVQLMASLFIMAGSAVFLLTINFKLGAATLAPAIVIGIITQLASAWVRRRNLTSMRSLGGMSAEIQESLQNFRVIIAFNRRDYFKKKFTEVNEENYKASVAAGVANNSFTPVYSFASYVAQLIILMYGIQLILAGQFTLGLLISFLTYANQLYNPLRQLAAIWTTFQAAIASLERVHEILSLETNLEVLPEAPVAQTTALLEFKDVSFGYPGGKEVLHKINLKLEGAKIYALVGPTGGGKTTTASLMARLYDPTSGEVFLNGKDIRTYSEAEKAMHIGFILQEPIVFPGTVGENIAYGNLEYKDLSNEALAKLLNETGLDELMQRFENGLDTKVGMGSDGLSLGQKQIIAFIRAVLRKPSILILDEATANIDTVTEQQLQKVLDRLPSQTTRVIIAHRLNTIAGADEIYFVNSGEVIKAGSMDHALEMLLHQNRTS